MYVLPSLWLCIFLIYHLLEMCVYLGILNNFLKEFSYKLSSHIRATRNSFLNFQTFSRICYYFLIEYFLVKKASILISSFNSQIPSSTLPIQRLTWLTVYWMKYMLFYSILQRYKIQWMLVILICLKVPFSGPLWYENSGSHNPLSLNK